MIWNIESFCLLQDAHLAYFQAVCVVVAILSWLLMRYTGNNVQVAVEAMACEGSGSSACGNLIINLKKNVSHETLNKLFRAM